MRGKSRNKYPMGDTLALEKHRTLVVRCFSFPNRGGGAVIKANMKKLILLVAFVLFVLSAVFYNDGRATGSAFFGDHTASRCDEENANFVFISRRDRMGPSCSIGSLPIPIEKPLPHLWSGLLQKNRKSWKEM